MQREIIRVNGKPVQVKLDIEPEQAEGRSSNFGGVDYQFVVNDDSGIMWIPREGRDAVLKSGARAGDCIELSKAKRGRMWAWTCNVLSDTAEPAPEPTQIYSNGLRLPKRAFANPTVADDAVAAPEPRVAASAPTQAVSPTTQHLVQCFRIAIDVLKVASQYAREQEFGASFLGSDVKSLALSIYINDCGGKGGAR